jgi:hypothetical protein
MKITRAALLTLLLAAGAAHAGWDYRTSSDKMRGTSSSFASITSENSVDFAFPYAGGSTADLTLRRRPSDGLNVMLQVTRGQFQCFMECHIAVKFDNGKVATFSATGPEDGTSTVLFIQNEQRFLKSLQGAKHLIIEAPFYNAGRKQFEFNVAGLDWPAAGGKVAKK